MSGIMLDDQPVVLDDLEFEVPCALIGDHAADVYVSCRFCVENAGALCTRHLLVKRAEAEQMFHARQFISCSKCARVAHEFDDLFTVVPLS